MAALTSLAIAGGVTAAAGLGAKVIGSIEAGKDRDKAMAAMQAAEEEIRRVGAPPDLSAEIIREKLKQAGVYTPQLEESIQQDATAFKQIEENPQLKEAQTKALQFLQQRGEQGLGAEDRAAFNKLQAENARNAEARRQSIIQNLQARGIAGSGAELAAQLSSAQAADAEASEQGDRIAAAAAQNALQAMAQAGNLSGQIRSQDYNVMSDKARAEDELNRFNTQAQIARQQRNIGSLNEAQRLDLAEKQRILEQQRADDYNEKLRQNQEQQNFWNNKLRQQTAIANAKQGQAIQHNTQAQATQAAWGGAGDALVGVGGSLLGKGLASVPKDEIETVADFDKKKNAFGNIA